MSSVSLNLSLPFIQANQAQKHVTHNESFQILDALAQISFIDTTLTTPPTSASPGDCYLVAGSASGDWAGQDGKIAVLGETAWAFYAPKTGWTGWDQAQDRLTTFDGANWVSTATNIGSTSASFGVNATADTTNRLTVASDAILATHDTTGDHQFKINKAASERTGSVLFQTGYSGRAELGTAGSDDFVIKTSSDGTTFNTALVADATTGQVSFPSGATGLTDAQFGAPDLVTRDYITSRGLDLVTNGTGLLANDYNYPRDFAFDGAVAPNLPGSMQFAGHYAGVRNLEELLPINPNLVYRFGCYVRQEAVPGDWSAYTNGDRHRQYLGLLLMDSDQNVIESRHHMRHKQGGVDSLTTLTAPLSPGDTVIEVADASGWNRTTAAHYARGTIIFGYKNSLGGLYDFYSRLVEFDLFDLGGVDVAANQITLKAPLPASLANPDDPNGTWPVGTRLANSSSGDNYKYSILNNFIPAQTDTWYETINHVGGLDLSGRNSLPNFSPGTAYVKLTWLANYSNRNGGWNGFADTGSDHKVWFAGVSAQPEPLAVQTRETSGSQAGRVNLSIPQPNPSEGRIDLVPAGLQTRQL